jgi:hypothetical protein
LLVSPGNRCSRTSGVLPTVSSMVGKCIKQDPVLFNFSP